MADKRANDPNAWIDPKKALEHAAGTALIITVPMREVRECLERGEEIPSVSADHFRINGFE